MKRILLLAVALTLVTWGCRPTPTPTSPGASPTAISSPVSSPATAPSPTPSTKPEPVPQTTLTLWDEGPITLDPHLARETASARFIVELFSGLVSLNQQLQVVPEIAESWSLSADGRTYTFKLRPGARFQSGRLVTAQDFEYSFERAADPKTQSPTALTYLGDIVGVREKLAGKAREVKGVRVVDDSTLEVTIDAPKAYFLAKLTHPTASVLDRENVASGGDWWRRPNGTGPFRLKEWKRDELLVLARNALYYGEKARVGSVVFRLLAGVPIQMYENGEIDITHVGAADLERVQDPANPLNRELRSTPTFTVYYVGFNHTRPPFDDARLRQAFALAIDKDRLVKVVLKDAEEKAEGFLPPGMPGYNQDLRGLPFDPARAKALIAQSRYGDASRLPTITFTTAGQGGQLDPVLSALLAMWRENLGVEVKVRQLEPDKYFYVLRDQKDELFDLGWAADYPDPENFLDALFHSGNQENTGEYANAEVDALLEQAREEGNAEKRLRLYQQAEARLVQDAAAMPLYFGRDYVLVKPYVEGFTPSPMPIPYLKYVSVKPH